MVDEILTGAGIPYKEVRFIYPPETTYAVYLDEISARGSDHKICIYDHSIAIELYSKKIDVAAEAAIEREIEARAIFYEKSDRAWLNKEGLFMTVYYFDYIEKKRGA